MARGEKGLRALTEGVTNMYWYWRELDARRTSTPAFGVVVFSSEIEISKNPFGGYSDRREDA